MMADSNDKAKQTTVLIADDDLDLLEQLELNLQTSGFEVISAESQQEAEQVLESRRPDIAVFDLMMENQDSGFVLCYKLKNKYPDVPVILATGVTSETGMRFDAATEEMRRWVHADVVLNKDLRFEQLQGEIHRLLKG